MTAPVAVRDRWLWLAATVLMLAEFLVFDRMTSRHHASIYPRWSDQIQYLTEAYMGYDELQAHGWWAGLRSSYTNPAAQGTLHDIVAVPLFGMTGPSRRVALDLNMLAFLAWLLALVAWSWLLRLEGREQAQAAPFEDARDGGLGDGELRGDMLLGAALAAQSLNGIGCGEGDLAWR